MFRKLILSAVLATLTGLADGFDCRRRRPDDPAPPPLRGDGDAWRGVEEPRRLPPAGPRRGGRHPPASGRVSGRDPAVLRVRAKKPAESPHRRPFSVAIAAGPMKYTLGK